MNEEWRVIPGFDMYEVSDQGRVRSWKRGGRGGHLWRAQPKLLKPGVGTHGYRLVVLRKDGKDHTRTVHKLVLLAFVGPAPDGLECRHLNGNEHDNRLANLRWGTRQENVADRMLHAQRRKL